MSGGVSELGGMKMFNNNEKIYGFLIGLVFLALIVISLGNAWQLNDLRTNNALTIFLKGSDGMVDFDSDFNNIISNQQVLFNSQVELVRNQGQIFNSLVLNDLGASGCRVTNEVQVDANSFAVSLLCPIKEAKQ